ncbi:MAG: type III-A CRISPR-associated protein Csm2 [Bacteroidota bacterium]|nr:type III-A CRISPR-associated protein Csm2 [Bacteroidota bacterium]
MEYPKDKLNPQWVHEPIKQEIVGWCESFGEYLVTGDNNYSEPLTTSQIRRFFGEVKRIEMNLDASNKENKDAENLSKITMLNPLLTYAVGRKMKKVGREMKCTSAIKPFYEELSKAITEIGKNKEHYKEYFKNFVKIFEAIVAYHKMYGGE